MNLLELDDEVLLVANRVQAGDRQDVSNNLPCYWFRQHRQESDTPVAIRPATGSYWTNSRPAVAVSPMTDNTDRINIVTIHILIIHFRIAWRNITKTKYQPNHFCQKGGRFDTFLTVNYKLYGHHHEVGFSFTKPFTMRFIRILLCHFYGEISSYHIIPHNLVNENLSSSKHHPLIYRLTFIMFVAWCSVPQDDNDVGLKKPNMNYNSASWLPSALIWPSLSTSSGHTMMATQKLMQIFYEIPELSRIIWGETQLLSRKN